MAMFRLMYLHQCKNHWSKVALPASLHLFPWLSRDGLTSRIVICSLMFVPVACGLLGISQRTYEKCPRRGNSCLRHSDSPQWNFLKDLHLPCKNLAHFKTEVKTFIRSLMAQSNLWWWELVSKSLCKQTALQARSPITIKFIPSVIFP